MIVAPTRIIGADLFLPHSLKKENMDINILKKLVSFNTESGKSNLPLISYAKNYFEDNGYIVKIIQSAGFANLFAYKNNTKPKIILSAHSDTVPASKAWKTNPYELTETKDKYIGLGVSDMKTFITIMFDLAKIDNDSLAFLLTFNEETDFQGANLIGESIIKPDDFVIIGEPTGTKAILKTKGAIVYSVKFSGPGGHGSNANNTVSAVEEGALFIKMLRDEIKGVKYHKDRSYLDPEISINFAKFSGGEAINKVAETSYLELESRVTDDTQDNFVENLISKCAKKVRAKTDVKKVFSYRPFCADDTVLPKLKKAGIKTAPGVSYATEATLYTKFSKNIVIFGPGDVVNAHQANEEISKKQILEYEKLIINLINSI